MTYLAVGARALIAVVIRHDKTGLVVVAVVAVVVVLSDEVGRQSADEDVGNEGKARRAEKALLKHGGRGWSERCDKNPGFANGSQGLGCFS